LAATASTIVPSKKSLPQTNIGRLKTNKWKLLEHIYF
jgi:hypothetical protein